ncbi:sensor histidine kinase [Halothiobacillus sp. DCM-1]|uniref:sensor histidine kinase n=1 Tax=Halothiobacillus sp. DCM-1 TaxID=3112558 RepID=UPI00325397D5
MDTVESHDPAPLLPAFCTPRIVLATLLLAFGVALLLAIAPGMTEDRWLRFGTVSWFMSWVSVLTISALCALQRPLQRLRPLALSSVVLGILLVMTAFISVLAYITLTHLGWLTSDALPVFVLHNLTIALVVGGMGIWIFSLHWASSRRLGAQSKAELDALHARIRPHFLFNSLNTVAALIETDPKAAEAAVLDLASVFRAALHTGDVSTLAEEVILARRYLALEHWRLGDRLILNWPPPPEPLPRVTVPVLTLQPLLENAIRYAVERRTEPTTVTVRCELGQRSVSILIENPLAADDLPASPGNGISLANIRDRLALMFGDKACLRAGVVDQQFRVKLVLPIAVEGAA